MKSFIKRILLRIQLRNANYTNLLSHVYVGKYSMLRTDHLSKICLNSHLSINNYVALTADEGGIIRFGSRISIGDYSTLRATRAVIEIGSYTIIGQGVKIISTNHKYKDKNTLIVKQDIDTDKIGIVIGEDCWLGAGCIVLPGVTVGNGVVIGANAVVTKDLPDYAVAVGNPAKIINYRNG